MPAKVISDKYVQLFVFFIKGLCRENFQPFLVKILYLAQLFTSWFAKNCIISEIFDSKVLVLRVHVVNNSDMEF